MFFCAHMLNGNEGNRNKASLFWKESELRKFSQLAKLFVGENEQRKRLISLQNREINAVT